MMNDRNPLPRAEGLERRLVILRDWIETGRSPYNYTGTILFLKALLRDLEGLREMTNQRSVKHALVNHPWFGSLWLRDAYITKGDGDKDYVVGKAWDDSDAGSPYMPDDYTGQYVTMNFPATCIRRWDEW